jgi:hypothetical protein
VKRTLARLAVSSILATSLAVSLVHPAVARPRSWFLPQVNVACTDASGPGTFAGNMQLSGVALIKGELTVGGTISGSCDGGPALDTPFRTTIEVIDASCEQASLLLGDITIKDTLVSLSEDPIVIEAGGAGNLRGALCALAKAEGASASALVRTLNRVLALQG